MGTVIQRWRMPLQHLYFRRALPYTPVMQTYILKIYRMHYNWPLGWRVILN